MVICLNALNSPAPVVHSQRARLHVRCFLLSALSVSSVLIQAATKNTLGLERKLDCRMRIRDDPPGLRESSPRVKAR
jgi:hypothetical protein